MKLKVFEYVVVLHPTEQELKQGKDSSLVAGPTLLLALDEEKAKVRAYRAVSTEYDDALDRLEVLVRPF